MRSLELVEDELYQSNIQIHDTINGGVPGHKAISFQFDCGLKAIVLNNHLIETDAEKKVILCHEKMHFDFPSTFYTFDDSERTIRMRERRVEVKLYKKLLPMNTLFRLVYSNRLNLWEIAELLDLPNPFVEGAWNYYSSLESWNKMRTDAEMFTEGDQ